MDFPEEIKLPILPEQYQTIMLSGATVNFDYCEIERAISLLREQYAVGTVTVKIVKPAPEEL